MTPVIRLSMLMLLPLAACSGDPLVQEAAEICGDEIDNNGNGLIDCEDLEYCGGPVCRAQQTNETGFDRDQLKFPDLDTLTCDFSFGTQDCSRKELCTFTFENASPDPATFNASCNKPPGGGKDPAILFEVEGEGGSSGNVSRQAVEPGESAFVTLYYNCYVAETFNVTCDVDAEGTDGAIPLTTVDSFDLQGTFIE